MGGLPMGKITGWTFGLVAMFVLTGLILSLAGHADQANGALGTAIGLVGGSAITTTIVVRNGGSDGTSDGQQHSDGAPTAKR